MILKAGLLICAALLAVDGDTVKCDGVLMRIMGPGEPYISGVDTPEVHRAKCDAEKRLGLLAKARLADIIARPGVRVEYSGAKDRTRTRRPLIWIRLPEGGTAGETLLKEGYAREWRPRKKASWCGT